MLALVTGTTAYAGAQNDVPSCYEASKVGVPAPAPRTELFILVDQTTPFDAMLQGLATENAGRLIQPGSAYVVATFSSFGQGRYMQVLSAGTLEQPIDESLRNSIGMKVLRTFDARMLDILSALKELSSRVRQSGARDMIVFVLSDMLENSSISSFYANHNVRAIDPSVEIKKVEAAQQFGDFGGARVFVLGAGLVQGDGSARRDRGVYRDPKTMAKLRTFWELYFARSNAQLVDFGAPALLSPVR